MFFIHLTIGLGQDLPTQITRNEPITSGCRIDNHDRWPTCLKKSQEAIKINKQTIKTWAARERRAWCSGMSCEANSAKPVRGSQQPSISNAIEMLENNPAAAYLKSNRYAKHAEPCKNIDLAALHHPAIILGQYLDPRSIKKQPTTSGCNWSISNLSRSPCLKTGVPRCYANPQEIDKNPDLGSKVSCEIPRLHKLRSRERS